MKLLRDTYFLSGKTDPIFLSEMCTDHCAVSYTVSTPDLRLNKYSRIIVTAYEGTTGHHLSMAVITATQITSSTSFRIDVRNVDCFRHGQIILHWSVFDEVESLTLPPIHFAHSPLLTTKRIEKKCHQDPLQWTIIPPPWISGVKAYHMQNFATGALPVIATGCVKPRGATADLNAFNAERTAGRTTFTDGFFFTGPTPDASHSIQSGVTATMRFANHQLKTGNVVFDKAFEKPPTVFLGAKRLASDVRPAQTAIALTEVTPTGFSFKALDMRCHYPDELQPTQYYWIAIGK